MFIKKSAQWRRPVRRTPFADTTLLAAWRLRHDDVALDVCVHRCAILHEDGAFQGHLERRGRDFVVHIAVCARLLVSATRTVT